MDLEKLVGLILSFSVSRNFGGYDISTQSFFTSLSNHLDLKLSTPGRSSVCEARQKLSWEAFPYLLNHFNNSIKGDLNKLKWKGHHIYAVDGSTLTLSHSKELKDRFPDIATGITKTHYPRARVVLATHMLSGIPKTLRVDDQFVGERSMLQSLLCDLETNSVLLLDRGFDGVGSLNKIVDNKKSFVCRLRSELWSSKEVFFFTKSRLKETIVTLKNKNKEEIRVRLLKYKKDRHGNVIVLATNLFNKKEYLRTEIWNLYSRRWDVETSYYRIKKLFKIEKFHSKKINGVLQEIWAGMLTLGLTSYLVMNSWKEKMKELVKNKKAPNFKNASIVLQRYFVNLIYSRSNETLFAQLKTISNEITSVLFLRQSGRKNPRISKQSLSTWVGGRKNKPKDRKGRSKIRRGIYA